MDILVVMKPTYEQLKAKNAALEAENALLKREVAELRTLIEQLLARIADLESQLNKSSKNSSQATLVRSKAQYTACQRKEETPISYRCIPHFAPLAKGCEMGVLSN